MYLVVKYNHTQREIFLYSSNQVSGYVMSKYDQYVKYFSLNTDNQRLKNENALLIQNFYNHKYKEIPNYIPEDTISNTIKVISANICNKSIDKRNNRITIDRGKRDGVKSGMGVISAEGIVGVVAKTNNNYSSIIPLINTISRTSATIKNKGYFGILVWKPYDYSSTILTTIPKDADVEVGDTIMTSGYSTIYPRGIMIGKVEKIDLLPGSIYYDLKVKLNNNFALLEDVYLIERKDLADIQELEKTENTEDE